MGKEPQRLYRICATYDTETCNLGSGEDARAFPVLFIFDDLREIEIESYIPDMDGERVRFMRGYKEALGYIEELIDYGCDEGIIPVIAAYNLIFDLQPILYPLFMRHPEMKVNAQSSTNVYTLDILDEDSGKTVLRFWDTFHLEMNGLAAMGATCGFAKASGEWDYSLVRTPETKLTPEELDYAKRDVQVIAAYLRFLCDANEWLTSDMLGNVVITKTSLVRQMARRTIGRNRIRKRNGSKMSLDRMFSLTCLQELPDDYDSYGLRTACFRGGFTFTAAATASTVIERVCSLDVTSMHHLFIAGSRVPVHFTKADSETLDHVCAQIVEREVEDVLRNYSHPFLTAVHARLRFRGLRLKKGSAFADYGIALLAQGKFKDVFEAHELDDANMRNADAENSLRSEGWHDSATGATFAFGKLYEAESCIVHVTEWELWAISQVYEWDSMEALSGEIAVKSVLPPDYVTLQTNILFARKTDAKHIVNEYHEGIPFYDIPASIPDSIAGKLRAGAMSADLLRGWYQSTVKGAFNSVYGTMAQNVFKPDYTFDDIAEMEIDLNSRTTADNFDDKKPKKCKVLYTYGMRIVGGSRVHLVLAIELLHRSFGSRIRICGGDTDSIKLSVDEDIEANDILEALEPLHEAARRAISVNQRRVRELFPHLASDLAYIGEFEVEPASKESVYYDKHLEAWNKARVSVAGTEAHITCAGLSRPRGKYHIEHYLGDMLVENEAERILPLVLGYNVFIAPELSHALGHKRPLFRDTLDEDVTDYLGNTYRVNCYRSIALYPTGRWLGDAAKRANAENIEYLRCRYSREVETEARTVRISDRKAELWKGEELEVVHVI